MLPVHIRPRLPRQWVDAKALEAELAEPQAPLPDDVPEDDSDDDAVPHVLRADAVFARKGGRRSWRMRGGSGRGLDFAGVGLGLEATSAVAKAAAEKTASEKLKPVPFDREASTRAVAMWTLDEDRLLVKGRMFDPVQDWPALVSAYASKRSTNRVSFAKKNVSPQLLKDRVARLEEPSQRARLTILVRDIQQEVKDAPIDAELLHDPILDAESQEDAFEAGPDELGDDVDIRLEGRNFRPAKLHGRIGRLAHFSKTIHDAVMRAGGGARMGRRAAAKTVAVRRGSRASVEEAAGASNASVDPSAGPDGRSYGGGVKFDSALGVLRLSDIHEGYDGIETYNHMSREVVERFLRFTQEPNKLADLWRLQQRVDRLEAARDRSSRAVKHGLHDERRDRRRLLAERYESEQYAVKQVLKRQLAADIRALKLSHARALSLELRKLASAHERRMRGMNLFYEREEVKSEEAVHRAWDRELEEMEHRVLVMRDSVSRVFNTAHIVPLTALACDLASSQLTRACARFVAQPGVFASMAADAAWSCPLISSQFISSVLGFLSMQDLLQVLKLQKGVHFFAAVERELTARRWIAAAEYRKLSNLQLYKLRFAIARKAVGEDAAALLDGSDSELDDDDDDAAGSAASASSAGRNGSIVPRPRCPRAQGGSASVVEVAEEEAGDLHALTGKGVDGGPPFDITDPTFLDVVEDEVNRRRDFGRVSISRPLLPNCVDYDEKRCRLTLRAAFRYATAHATKARGGGEFGRWQFEVEILSMPASGATLSVGWDTPRTEVEWKRPGETPRGRVDTLGQLGGRGVAIPGITPPENPDTGFGVAWQTDGKTDHGKDGAAVLDARGLGLLLSGGRAKSGYDTYGESDVVGVLLDQNTTPATVRFVKNGAAAVPRPNEGRSRAGGGPSAGGIRLAKPGYRLVPAICMYSSDTRSDVTVRVNFVGPFRYPAPGFEPYGAHWPRSDAVDAAASASRDAVRSAQRTFYQQQRDAAAARRGGLPSPSAGGAVADDRDTSRSAQVT